MMMGTRIKVGSLRDAYEAQRSDATNTTTCRRCHSEKGWLDYAFKKGVLIYCGADAGFHGPFEKDQVIEPSHRV